MVRTAIEPPEESPSQEDRVAAALCYVIPIVGSLYVMVVARSKPNLWRHAIQALAVYAILTVVINVLKLFPVVGGFALDQPAIGVGMLILITFAAVAYRGYSLRLPWIADFADRWRGRSAEVIGAGLAELKERSDVAVHRRNLRQYAGAPPKDVLPKIDGTSATNGFEIRVGSTYALLQRFFNRGELVVAKWPLRLGDETRVRFRVRPRANGKVERAAARLQCAEVVRYRDEDGDRRSQGLVLQTIPVADAVLRAGAADGSASAEWTLRVPREAPPSFVAEGGGIGWQLLVEVRFAGGRTTTQSFDLLVVPQVVAP